MLDQGKHFPAITCEFQTIRNSWVYCAVICRTSRVSTCNAFVKDDDYCYLGYIDPDSLSNNDDFSSTQRKDKELYLPAI